jgi:hypothetical protein
MLNAYCEKLTREHLPTSLSNYSNTALPLTAAYAQVDVEGSCGKFFELHHEVLKVEVAAAFGVVLIVAK